MKVSKLASHVFVKKKNNTQNKKTKKLSHAFWSRSVLSSGIYFWKTRQQKLRLNGMGSSHIHLTQEELHIYCTLQKRVILYILWPFWPARYFAGYYGELYIMCQHFHISSRVRKRNSWRSSEMCPLFLYQKLGKIRQYNLQKNIRLIQLSCVQIGPPGIPSSVARSCDVTCDMVNWLKKYRIYKHLQKQTYLILLLQG